LGAGPGFGVDRARYVSGSAASSRPLDSDRPITTIVAVLVILTSACDLWSDPSFFGVVNETDQPLVVVSVTANGNEVEVDTIEPGEIQWTNQRLSANGDRRTDHQGGALRPATPPGLRRRHMGDSLQIREAVAAQEIVAFTPRCRDIRKGDEEVLFPGMLQPRCFRVSTRSLANSACCSTMHHAESSSPWESNSTPMSAGSCR